MINIKKKIPSENKGGGAPGAPLPLDTLLVAMATVRSGKGLQQKMARNNFEYTRCIMGQNMIGIGNGLL